MNKYDKLELDKALEQLKLQMESLCDLIDSIPINGYDFDEIERELRNTEYDIFNTKKTINKVK